MSPIPRAALDMRDTEQQAQTHKQMLTAQHDYGKDDGDRANTSLAKEIRLGQKSRDQALLNAVNEALKQISEAHLASASIVGRKSMPHVSRPFLGCAIASHARN